jgi:hypothetical protein
MFTGLAQNNTTANQTLAGILINDVHRYTLLRFFDNERSFTMTTVGPQVLTLTTATLAAGLTMANLTTAWTYNSCQQLVVFSDGEQRTVFFVQGSIVITWQSPTTAVQTSASISCAGVQSYPLPANISKLKTASITIGQLVYIAYPVNSVQEWVKLNALPYNAAYPAYFFMYNDQLSFWPIPSNTGQIISLYAQVFTPDMTYQDYISSATIANGTISDSVGSNAITGSSTTFNTVGTFPVGVDLTFSNIFLTITPPGGDGLNYQVQSVASDTALTLTKPIVYAPKTSGNYFSIGQYPLLAPDFHDALVYGALRTYFSSIAKDTDKAGYFGGLYQEKLQQMEFYLSSKQVNVDLGSSPVQRNPNLYNFVAH